MSLPPPACLIYADKWSSRHLLPWHDVSEPIESETVGKEQQSIKHAHLIQAKKIWENSMINLYEALHDTKVVTLL